MQYVTLQRCNTGNTTAKRMVRKQRDSEQENQQQRTSRALIQATINTNTIPIQYNAIHQSKPSIQALPVRACIDVTHCL